MMKTLHLLGLLVLVPTGAALAENDCFVPMSNWQPREAISALAKQNGWVVRRIKIDDGCYEIDGTDAEGRRIEVTVQPATLQVMRIEYEEHEENHDREGDDDGHQERNGE